MLIPCLILAAVVPAQAAAPVTDVTVYSDRARVTRTAVVEVAARATVAFPPLPRGVDAESVRLEASGGALVATIEIRPAGGLPRDEARALLGQIDDLDDAIAQARREAEVVRPLVAVTEWRPSFEEDEEEDGKRRTAKLDARGWKRAVAFLTGFSGQMQTRLAASEAKLGELQRRREELAARGRALATPAVGGLRVVATLAGSGRTKLRLRYDVGQARWTPRYQIRLDPSGTRVTVALDGVVNQTTGEDWERARLVLSTAVPFSGAVAPALSAWRIGERERFIPTSVAVREDGEGALLVPPLPVLPSEDSLLRRALLGAAPALGAAPVTKELRDLDFLENMPMNSRDQVHAAMAPAPAFGPGQLGGYVFDQTGTPIKGVKLVASGAAGGTLVKYSNEEGFFRFTGLAAGTYDVSAQAPRLRTVTQRGVVVGAGRGAEVNLVMEVEGTVEEVRVVEKAPVVSTTAANVKEVWNVQSAGYGVGTRMRGGGGTSLSGGVGEGPRDRIWLAPPAGYRRPRLAADAPATLAGGHDLWFEAAREESLLSGGGDRRVPLAEWTWPVTVERTVYPAIATDAFLVATLASPAPGVLPGGPASLYVGGDPVGTAALKLVVPGERFTLPLGVDRALEPVRRVRVESHEEGVLWKDDVSRYTVTTEITNPHATPVRLRIRDQIPVSPDKSVEVHLVKSTPAASLEAATGAVEWALALPPGGTSHV
jgi:Domain of unknown function (DUF4139)/N-terminal domain of unknown function (DUF4140)